MSKQVVRRRRAALALLVAAALTLLTAYFGESAGGVLHALQRGTLQVLAPIQEGTGRALKPLRDLAGWFDDTFDARKERDRLRAERLELRKQVVGAENLRRENLQLRRLLRLDRDGLAEYEPVTARVIARSPTLWYHTVNIDKGRVDGVRVNQPVVSGEGLVGKVSAVTRGAAQVTLITDHTSGVSAKANTGSEDRNPDRAYGVVQTRVGSPDDLLLNFVSPSAGVDEGDLVTTAGSRSSKLESLFPPDIPVGVVTRADPEEIAERQRVHIRPFAELRRLDFVQVLTAAGGDPGADADRAQLP